MISGTTVYDCENNEVLIGDILYNPVTREKIYILGTGYLTIKYSRESRENTSYIMSCSMARRIMRNYKILNKGV